VSARRISRWDARWLLLVCFLAGVPAWAEIIRLDGPQRTRLGELEARLRAGGVEPELSAVLEGLAHHPDELARADAAQWLGIGNQRTAIPALLGVARNDPAPVTRRAAALALHTMGRREGREALRRELQHAAQTFDQVTLARDLAGLGDPSGFPHVQAALEAPDSWYTALLGLPIFLRLEETRAAARAAILEQLEASEPRRRELALLVLTDAMDMGAFLWAEVEPILVHHTQDRDQPVRQKATELLDRWRGVIWSRERMKRLEEQE